MITRSTTPTIELSVPVATSTITKLSLVFVQDNNVVLKKALSDVVLGDHKVSVTLTQEETLVFKQGNMAIRLKFKTTDGKVLASEKILTSVEDIEDTEVM